MDLDLNQLIDAVARFRPGRPLDKFISYAVFPNFKNIEPGTRMSFDFPLTALVGANGSGKSSILHALWGMPKRYSTSRFWFSTAVDPIAEGHTNGINRYFYSHWISGLDRLVQTKKVRGRKRLGYWEPARAMPNDGMEPMPDLVPAHLPYRSKDRWNPVDRKVVYINFKCEFSAFDRYFYFTPRGVTLEDRQEAILKGAQRLRIVLDKGLTSYAPGGKQSVFEHRDLTEEEMKWVKFILGHDYASARYVFHRLYGKMEAPSVIFNRGDIQYSEAFAGSGELSVVRAVIELLGAEKYSLVLLDEPETSLHPGAQKRLVAFLLEQIRTKHLQIVMSTHSQTIVDVLPPKAVKVLEEGPSGRMRIVENTHPQIAFNRLGHVPEDKILIVVEDDLLLTLVEIALITFDPGERQALRLHVPPDGADAILKYWIPAWVADGRQAYVLLDGDKDSAGGFPDPEELPVKQQKGLAKLIKERLGLLPPGITDGHAEPASSYIKWIRERTRFLSAVSPEFVVLEAMVGDGPAGKLAKTNQQAKDALVQELQRRHLETTAQGLRAAAKIFITPHHDTNRHILKLREALKTFLAHHGALR